MFEAIVGLKESWQRAGRVERAGYVVAAPLLVVFVLTFDWTVAWTFLATVTDPPS